MGASRLTSPLARDAIVTEVVRVVSQNTQQIDTRMRCQHLICGSQQLSVIRHFLVTPYAGTATKKARDIFVSIPYKNSSSKLHYFLNIYV